MSSNVPEGMIDIGYNCYIDPSTNQYYYKDGVSDPIKITKEIYLSDDLRISYEQSQATDKFRGEAINDIINDKHYMSEFDTDDIAKRMKDLSTVINKLDNKFNNNEAVYTQYLLFKVNGNVLVDTASKDWNTNNLVSFSLKQNGSGQANQFTLTILFPPNDINISNIFTIESLLLTACSITEPDSDCERLKELKSQYMDCEFKYGYGDDKSLRSPTYVGKVMKYTSSLRNGNLEYVITGYGSLYPFKEVKLSSKKEYLEGAQSENGLHPFKFIENVFKEEFDNPSSKYYGMFKLKFLSNCNNDETPHITGDEFAKFTDKTLFNLLDDLLKGATTAKENEIMSTGKMFAATQKQVYGYTIESTLNEDDSIAVVAIYKMPSISNTATDSEKLSALTPHMNIQFNWFAPSKTGVNFLVKSWNPEFDGALSIALASTLLHSGETYETLDSEGNIVEVPGLGASRLGLNDTKITVNTIQEYSHWSLVTQYPYKARLVVQGCPCEVPMTGRIKINAMIGTQLHHSSGTYFIVGKTDTLNSSGYFTEFQLFKVTATYNPKMLEAQTGAAVTWSEWYDEDETVSGLIRYGYDSEGNVVEVQRAGDSRYEDIRLQYIENDPSDDV